MTYTSVAYLGEYMFLQGMKIKKVNITLMNVLRSQARQHPSWVAYKFSKDYLTQNGIRYEYELVDVGVIRK